MSQLKISPGNIKMGSISSVSLPAGVTCRADCACREKCYAMRMERLRPSVRNAYKSNLELLKNDPDTFWREAEASVMMSRFFRFHVSGDIPTDTYLFKMAKIAERNPHCQILCFTKKYDIVNSYLSAYGDFPSNLHIILSAWAGLEMDNPYGLPEAHVLYRDGTTTARKDAVECSGNCTNCAMTDGGCWTLHRGQQVVFREH